MTAAEVSRLIAAGESLTVEFKGEERQRLSDAELVEAVVCLANRPGTDPAWLLVGVEDDGRVTGAHPRQVDRTDPARMQALVANRTRPALSVRVDVVDVAGKHIVVIDVPGARSPVGTTDGKYVRRALSGDGRRHACRCTSTRCSRPGRSRPARSFGARAAGRALAGPRPARIRAVSPLRARESGPRRCEPRRVAGPQAREGAGRSAGQP